MSLNSQLRLRLGPPVRRWRKRLDNPEVRLARLLAERLRSAPPDVLHLGASEAQYVGPNDVDQRTLPVMMAEALAPDLTLYSVNNAGYHPKMFSAYLNVVGASPVRPIVVLSLTVRFGFTPWALHPEYGFARSLRALTRIKPGSPPWRFRAPVRLTRASDFLALDQMAYPTLGGTRTIGEFRHALKRDSGSDLIGEERTRVLYAYHQGGVVSEQYLADVTALGAQLRALGLKAVVYHTPTPIDRGVELHGDGFRTRVIENLGRIDEAFRAGYGPIDILQTGPMLSSAEFINPDDAIEHANELGRHRMTDMITQAIRAQRDGSSGSTSEP
jgi:hypothetical protein